MTARDWWCALAAALAAVLSVWATLWLLAGLAHGVISILHAAVLLACLPVAWRACTRVERAE
jgi:predicted cation transporter